MKQSEPYISLGEPRHWAQENDYIVRAGRPLKTRNLPTLSRYILLQALLWQLDRFVPYDAVIDVVWGNNPDGGPLYAKSVISIMVFRLRQEGHNIETWTGIGLRLRPRD